MEHYTVDEMTTSDRAHAIAIFHEGVSGGDPVLDVDNPDNWIDLENGQNLVARLGDRIVGWAAICPIHDQELPEGVSKVSVFVSRECRRKGIGRLLLNTAIGMSKEQGVGSLICGIVPGNVPAIMLHKACGFKALGMIREAGRIKNKQQDAVLLHRNIA